MSDRDKTAQAQADIAWLEQHGAVAGVAAVVAERRFQIEQRGYDVQHDRDEHDEGWLGWQAGVKSVLGSYMTQNDPVKADALPLFAEAGAMAAAEIDRLTPRGE
jgi:hypothetical protein